MGCPPPPPPPITFEPGDKIKIFLDDLRSKASLDLKSLKLFLISSAGSKVIGGGGHPTPHPFILEKCVSRPVHSIALIYGMKQDMIKGEMKSASIGY